MKITEKIDRWVRDNYRNVVVVDFILEIDKDTRYLAHVCFGDKTAKHFAGSQWIEIPLELISL